MAEADVLFALLSHEKSFHRCSSTVDANVDGCTLACSLEPPKENRIKKNYIAEERHHSSEMASDDYSWQQLHEECSF